MNLLLEFMTIAIFLSIFIFQYLESKKIYVLLGIPLIIYCFVLVPFLQQKINNSIMVVITLIVCAILCRYIYRGDKTSKDKV